MNAGNALILQQGYCGEIMQLFIFSVNDKKYAFPLSAVERVYPSAQIVPIQDVPKGIIGVIDIQGDILPVMSFLKIVGDDRAISLDDKFVVMRWKDRRIVLVVEKVFSVSEVDEEEFVPAQDVMEDTHSFGGVAKVSGELVLLQKIDELMLR